MLFIIIVVVLFVVLDIAALRWGADSRERMNSLEWEHREHQEQLLATYQA